VARAADGGRIPAAVLWDMDGTLIDSEKLWTVSLTELTHSIGGVLTPTLRQSLVGSNLDATVRSLFGLLGRTPSSAEYAQATAFLTNRTIELFRAGLPWRPGAREALRAVRSAGLPMALVTSTERQLTEIALDTIGREFFTATVCGDEVDGQNKPLPEPYRKAARMLGVPPGDCVAVEDSTTGAASAESAGAAVLVVPCDAVVPDSPRRVFRDSLVGVDVEALAQVWRVVNLGADSPVTP
jgi:HAD superfamily hydrolase (TIGR01509 family)